MFNYYIIFCYILVVLNVVTGGNQRECIVERVPNADTVCVCNATYCDDIPPVPAQKVGSVYVFESNKIGYRFKQTEIMFNRDYTTDTFATLKNVSITINKQITYQSINGFGGAFTDSTGQMLKCVNESLADLLIDSYFSSNGIEYSIGRIPIGGTDYSDRPYSYDDTDEDLELKHFELQKEDNEWKIPFIKKALSVSPHKLKLFGSPWSPPSWMKTNHKFNESGSIRGDVGGKYYQSWANYIVKFLDAYKSHDIHLWGITVENEPVMGGLLPKHLFNCLNLTAQQERDFVKNNLGPVLEKSGYGKAQGFQLMIFDDSSNYMQSYLAPILADKEAAKYVSGIAYHWYVNMLYPGGFPDTIFEDIHQKYGQNYFLMNTEACHINGAEEGRWDLAERYANDIIKALNHYVSGWVEWNMALDMRGGPTWPVTYGCGGTVNIDCEKGVAYKQPSFYALGHFSKFIPPNSRRVNHTVDNPVDGLLIVTLVRPDNRTVVVAVNKGNEDIVLNITVSTDKWVSHKIGSHSIQSYIW
ncbi:lysosomal acid glucosylceramidase-like [Oppia nitens]|uniref:lysosomal acid glucosylceramidase-like n=1 Tax=Oppia nitens TaxID=1686743 RepID=UPI0023DB3815|nr:lysosomal acid glucosylceramidase-like [Oppia nitens]